MKLKYHQQFAKELEKLTLKQKLKVKLAIDLLVLDRSIPRLRLHALKGKMLGKYSISAGGDLRIIYKEEGNYLVVIFISVGSHNQVY